MKGALFLNFFYFFLKRPQGAHWSAEAGSPQPTRCENGSLAQNFQRVREMISPGTTRARTHGPAHLEEWRRGKRWPQCETSISKCALGVRVQRTFIFSPASYSSPGTFEAVVGWYGFALVSTLVCLLIQYNRAAQALMLGRCYWYTPRGARAHMTPTSLCMVCAANHIMRFPDQPSFYFHSFVKSRYLVNIWRTTE